MSITPKGQAAMPARQPLHTSAWMTTVSNWGRMIPPGGHTPRHPPRTHGLHTSLNIRPPPVSRPADPGRQVIDHTARGQAAPAPVPRHADVVDRLSGDAHHADAIRHEGLRANVSSWARYDHPVEIPDALLGRERLAHLDEQLGL